MAEKINIDEGYFEMTSSAENTREIMDKLREARREIGTLEEMIETDIELLENTNPDNTEKIDMLQEEIVQLSFERIICKQDYQAGLDIFDSYYAQMHNGHLPN